MSPSFEGKTIRTIGVLMRSNRVLVSALFELSSGQVAGALLGAAAQSQDIQQYASASHAADEKTVSMEREREREREGEVGSAATARKYMHFRGFIWVYGKVWQLPCLGSGGEK